MHTVIRKLSVTLISVVLGLVAGCAQYGAKPADARAEAPAAAKPAAVDPATQAALDSAASAVEAAGKEKSLWRDTETLLEEAQAAAQTGDNAGAQKLAKKAKTQADLAVNQAYLEKARAMIDASKAKGSKSSNLAAAETALMNHEGKKAYELISAK
jgi:hypothetical protein